MISETQVKRWLREVKRGTRSPRQVTEALRRLPFDDIGFARLDTHRALRRGMPEVIFCEGKSPAQLVGIVKRMKDTSGLVLLTRLTPEFFEGIQESLADFQYEPVARIAYRLSGPRRAGRGRVVVVTGGTADISVAEEAALCLELFGSRAVRLYDVGVAGIHRLLSQWEVFNTARVAVVVAGMEGALASVVGGLVRCPVVAVPTSVGYGAAYQGLAPLLTMLNSCSPGIGVVNIDNGFGAAYLAHQINSPKS